MSLIPEEMIMLCLRQVDRKLSEIEEATDIPHIMYMSMRIALSEVVSIILLEPLKMNLNYFSRLLDSFEMSL